MGFFKSLFGGKETTDEEREAKRQENNFDVLKYDGIQALRIGKTDYSIACLTHALDIKEDREAHIALVNAYVHKGDLDSACDELEEMCEIYPDDKTFPVTWAETLFQLERYDEMESACAHALELDPSLAAPHYLLARGSFAKGALEDAEASATKAIENNAELYEAYLLRAEILLQSGKTDAALADVDHLIEADYVTDEVLMQKGKILEQSGDTENALIYYNNVLEENPFIEDAYVRLGALQLQAGDTGKAQATLEDAIEQMGERSQLLLLSAAIKERGGDAEGAAADKARAAELAAEEQEAEGSEVDIEREMQNKYSSINPFQ